MASSLAGTTGQNAPSCHRDPKRVSLRSSPPGPQIALFPCGRTTAGKAGLIPNQRKQLASEGRPPWSVRDRAQGVAGEVDQLQYRCLPHFRFGGTVARMRISSTAMNASAPIGCWSRTTTRPEAAVRTVADKNCFIGSSSKRVKEPGNHIVTTRTWLQNSAFHKPQNANNPILVGSLGNFFQGSSQLRHFW